MLQPTPQLLVRPAASLAASFKLLTHPKVPLTPGESKQLLNIITTSFRQKLAQEHDGPVAASSPRQCLPQHTPSKDKERSHSKVSIAHTTPTDRHMHGILSNPLFKPISKTHGSSTRDPMAVFEEACAHGLMTASRARACLIAKRQNLRDTSKDVLASIRQGDAGAKVFKWLLSSGAMEDSSWLLPNDIYISGGKKILPDIIFQFLVLEGRQELLWDLLEHHVIQRTKNGKVDVLLYHLSRALARFDSLDAAYQGLSRAQKMLRQHGISQKVSDKVIAKTVHTLIQSTLTIEQPRPTAGLFDRFSTTVQAVIPQSSISLVHLRLCHPTTPNAAPAFQFLKGLPATQSENGNVNERAHEGVHDTKAIIWLALDAAKVLLKQEKYDNARWVMNFLQERYPEHIGAERQYAAAKLRVEQMESEATNLELLNNLELGLGAP